MAGERTERRLAAILAADVAGYSRLMGADEVGTLAALKAIRREVVDPALSENKGRIFKTTGDGLLVEFASAVDAVSCAVAVQAAMAKRDHSGIRFRIGINIGDIIIEGDDIFGEGVNVAARVENECEPGNVCLSGSAYEQVRGKTAFAFDDLGERRLKNIDRPVRLYAARSPAAPAVRAKPKADASKQLDLPDRPSIAVLPFQNMSGDPEQEYFADGIVEDIITALSRFKSLFVIARNTSFTYKGKAADIKQIGRELGVRYVLEGSVRKAGKQIRITGQLIDAATGAHVWAERLDREMADIFALQDEVTQSVVSAIEPSLRSAEIARKQSVPTNNLGAYDLYLRGMSEASQITEEHLRKAERFLRQAVELDPYYSDAWAMLADTIGRQLLHHSGADIALFQREARTAALKAVELDADNGMALGIAAWCLAVLKGPIVEAVEFAQRAMRAHPNSSVIRGWCGWAFVYGGEFERAIETLAPVRRMSPFDPRIHQVQAATTAALFFQKKFGEAEQLARESLARFPAHPVLTRYFAASLVQLGRIPEAQAVINQFKVGHPSISIAALQLNFRHRWMFDLLIGSLRKAGFPE